MDYMFITILGLIGWVSENPFIALIAVSMIIQLGYVVYRLCKYLWYKIHAKRGD